MEENKIKNGDILTHDGDILTDYVVITRGGSLVGVNGEYEDLPESEFAEWEVVGNCFDNPELLSMYDDIGLSYEDIVWVNKPKCQWKVCKDNLAKPLCKDDGTYSVYSWNSYKFCPYCGKEIEVTNDTWKS